MPKFHSTYKFIYSVFLAAGLLSACNCSSEQKQSETSEAELKETLLKVNKLFVERENERINSYIARHNYNMLETGTGLRYELLNESEGDKAGSGDNVKLIYTCKVIDGAQLVGNDGLDTLTFTVGKSEIPSGINEAVQLMSEGTKARLILPTHLAYGLTGDENNVPSNAALHYNVQILRIIKANKLTTNEDTISQSN